MSITIKNIWKQTNWTTNKQVDGLTSLAKKCQGIGANSSNQYLHIYHFWRNRILNSTLLHSDNKEYRSIIGENIYKTRLLPKHRNYNAKLLWECLSPTSVTCQISQVPCHGGMSVINRPTPSSFLNFWMFLAFFLHFFLPFWKFLVLFGTFWYLLFFHNWHFLALLGTSSHILEFFIIYIL